MVRMDLMFRIDGYNKRLSEGYNNIVKATNETYNLKGYKADII